MSVYDLYSDAKFQTALSAIGAGGMGQQEVDLLKQIFVAAGNSSGGGGGGTTTWGSITGTLSNQTDLQTALDGKTSPMDVATILARANYQYIYWDATSTAQTVSGSGSTSALGTSLQLQTGATAGSRSQRQWPFATADAWLAAGGSAQQQIDWTRPVMIGFAMSAQVVTANGVWRMRIGRNAETTGDLTDRGVQIRVANLTPFYGVHNGTTFTESAAQPVLTAGSVQNNFRIYSDGAGNVQFWRNGVLALTMAGGPTTVIGNFGSSCATETLNNADAANYRIHHSPVRIIVMS